MTHPPNRFRRFAVSCIAGLTAFSGISVLALASPASAAPGPGSSIVAATAPNIAVTGTNQPVGNQTITLAPGTTWATGDSIAVHVTDQANNGTITFDHNPSLSITNGAGNTSLCLSAGSCTILGAGTNTETITFDGLGQTNTPSASTISLTNIGYTTTGSAPGAVIVTATGIGTLAGTITAGVPAANASVVATNATSLTAMTTPLIGPGATAAAGNWALGLSGSGTSWTTGEKYYIAVARHDTTNCETLANPNSIGFSAVPTVTASAITNGATTTPTLTAAVTTAPGSSCATFSGVNNLLVLTFTNSGTVTSAATAPVTIMISGVKYAVSGDTYTAANSNPPSTNLGNVDVYGGLLPPTFTTSNRITPPSVPNDSLVSGSTSSGFPGAPSNASIGISTLAVTANSPSTTLSYNFSSSGGQVVNQAISNITIAEGTPGSLAVAPVVGWACIALSPGAGVGNAAEWNGVPTVAASGGGMVVGNATLLTPGGQTGPTELAFQVTTVSSGTPGTVTISGIKVNAPSLAGFNAQAALWFGAQNAGDACTGADTNAAATGIPYAGNDFTVFNVAGRSFGQTMDATAAQVFPSANRVCRTETTSLLGAPAAVQNAVLTTNASYQDALSASYLAGGLVNSGGSVNYDTFGTGVLLTPTDTLSSSTIAALRLAGVTDVYVVGGPLAVSQAVIDQLKSTPVYNCDGSIHSGLLGSSTLNVHWIYGQTADATAQQVGQFFGPGAVGRAAFPGAYGTTLYNDTTGSSGSPASSAPDAPVSTAILATNAGFQDAASASAIAAHNHFPLFLTGQSTLSPSAMGGLVNDAVQQVIVAGGQLAISDTVLTQLEGMGISVLRVAGQDYTDTAQMLARFELGSTNTTGQVIGLNWDPSYLMVARGDFYTDAIVAGPVSAASGGLPVLLTFDPNTAGNYLPGFLKQVGQVGYDPINDPGMTINNLWFIGGPLAISTSLESSIGTSLNG